jgi:hypothetical protein
MGVSMLQSSGPSSHLAAYYGLVFSSLHVPKAAAVGDEQVGLPGELVRVQHASVLLPDPCLTLMAAISLPTSRL